MRSKNNYYRLYVNEPLAKGQKLLLEVSMRHYLKKVLRLKLGDLFNVFNEKDGQFVAEVTEQGFLVTAFCSLPSRLPYLHLGFCMVKNAAMAQIIDAATQLGATCITPIISQYVNNKEFNPERYRRIAIEATEQSGRCAPPEILPPIPLTEFVAQEFDLILFADEGQLRQNLNHFTQQLKSSNKIAAIVGPEGGFAPQEQEALRAKAISICLGEYILRAEVACTSLLSQIGIMRT
jgi:16S rRNA (uracil1498-N3)-methyltransferase